MTPTPTAQALAGLPGIDRLRALMAVDPNEAGLTGLLGMRLSAVEPGEARFVGEPDAAFLNLVGNVHGGWAATLLDSAMGCAGHTLLGPGQALVTMEIKVSYHKPIKPGTERVEATGVVISRGRRAISAEAKLRDAQGGLLASGSSTLMILEPR